MESVAPVVPCVVHCFTGTTAELKEYVSRGFYIGLTGFVMHRLESSVLREWMHTIPEDRLLIETDAPYMGFKVRCLGAGRMRNTPALILCGVSSYPPIH
jgi:Tat protein secretion system quality control protein TatD with DNase activity